jgi:hypothetical protein
MFLNAEDAEDPERKKPTHSLFFAFSASSAFQKRLLRRSDEWRGRRIGCIMSVNETATRL